MSNLYRALYISATGQRRGMTFAAASARQASLVAAAWTQSGERLLTVKLERALQPQLELS